ncbi:MAG: hypothetical protein QOG67_2829 [Verrucomicrobiota bacterium]|jgi:photosystem II stability/assembly factor-like uncharacterized protein
MSSPSSCFLKLRSLAGILFLLATGLSAIAQGPLLPIKKEKHESGEAPAQRFIENLPPTPNLPRSRDQSAKISAFQRRPLIQGPSWTALGPFPIPNGNTEDRVDPVSGRVTAIAVHPNNPDVAYVGTAQGGLYRTLDGGTTWTQLMDNVNSSFIGTPLAIGAVAIDPANASTVLVGTGEGNNSGDSYFGNGLYIITAADSTNPLVNGPYRLRVNDNADIFTGRSIVAIAVDPANHNNVFCATTSGFAGIVPSLYSTLPPRGLYRSTNAFAGVDGTGTPVFAPLNVNLSEPNAAITSVVVDPGNGNIVLCTLYSQSGTGSFGGIYRSTTALTATPTFTRSMPLPDFTNAKLAINNVGGLVTVYAATEEGVPNGRVYKSSDGGSSFGLALSDANGFAGDQGFYDIAIAVDPTNGNNIYVGGKVRFSDTGAYINDGIFLYSNDGGSSFHPSVTGLHTDTHAIAVSPSTPSVIYHGNDGGVWRSSNYGMAWASLNNRTFSATQFEGLALHPTDAKFSIGGTQDVGTEFLNADGSFTRADGGDGGYSLIDRNATDTTFVTMYHTYFNRSNSIIGTARALSTLCGVPGEWSFHGASTDPLAGPYCDGSFDTLNGISLSDAVNFYAPQTLGPGNPNTWYFGSNKLYRSVDRADTAIVASQSFSAPISAIAISAQDDNVRIIGLNDGRVFATTIGSSTLRQIAGPGASSGTSTTPAAGVGRIAIDPSNKNIAYICFNGFGSTGSPIAHVWKTTNLTALNSLTGTVTFLASSSGLPDIPVNAIAIDPVTATSRCGSSDIYVGTDAGVFYSADNGSSWSTYGNGFPHVAVFGLEIQNPSRIIRAATHGRGIYETPTVSTASPTPTPTSVPTPSPAYGEITSPLPCSPLIASTVTFSWTPGNATAFWLTVGNTFGASDIFSSGQTGGNFFTVTNLPTDGRNIYVRLWSFVGGVWYNPPQDYVFIAQRGNVMTPIIAPKSGTYKKKVLVSMACGTPGASIHYTLDGSVPTANSGVYGSPFPITHKGTTTVRAKAFKDLVPESPPTAASYTIR